MKNYNAFQKFIDIKMAQLFGKEYYDLKLFAQLVKIPYHVIYDLYSGKRDYLNMKLFNAIRISTKFSLTLDELYRELQYCNNISIQEFNQIRLGYLNRYEK